MPSDATADDVLDYIRPTAPQKPDMIIIHTGTNNIQKKVNTLQKIRKITTKLKKSMLTMKYKLLSQVSFTGMINTSRKKLNKSTESSRSKGIMFINDNNIDGSYLNITLNSFMTEAVIIKKAVHWFSEQINGLVSIW